MHGFCYELNIIHKIRFSLKCILLEMRNLNIITRILMVKTNIRCFPYSGGQLACHTIGFQMLNYSQFFNLYLEVDVCYV